MMFSTLFIKFPNICLADPLWCIEIMKTKAIYMCNVCVYVHK